MLFAELGCSGRGGSVQGTVRVDGCPGGPDIAACPGDGGAALPCGELEPRPEAGATVSLNGGERETVTGDDGRFSIPDLDAGEYAVAISVPWTAEVRQVRVVSVGGAEPAGAELAVTFTAAGVLEGQVLPPLGPPPEEDAELYGGVAGVDVQLVCPPRTAVTDAAGRFRFEGVPRGPRRLTASGLGLVGTGEPLTVERGGVTFTEIRLVYGRPPEAPDNTPPHVVGPVEVTPLDDAGDGVGVVQLRPPTPLAGGLARGQRAALRCAAEDDDGDPLQWVWSATSGTLQAGSGAEAVLVAGAEDVGVACTVLDGRGGVDAAQIVLEVHDSYFGGAALTENGALFAAAYGADFDLVAWEPGNARRDPRPGSQWLPRARGRQVAFIERPAGGATDTLWVGTVSLAATPPVSASRVADAASGFWGFDVAGDGVVWIDDRGGAWFSGPGSESEELGGGYDGEVAGSDRHVALGRGDWVDLVAVDEDSLAVVPTVVDIVFHTGPRTPGSLATDGTRIAYWTEGRPVLAAESGATVELGPERLAAGAPARMRIEGDYAAYSSYSSPLHFLEATVVRLEGDQPAARARVAVGPSEVLDLEGGRLLLGRPRSQESEPSGDLWIVELDPSGVGP